ALNRPLNQLIKKTAPLSAKLVDDFFTAHHKYKVNEDVIKQVQLYLHDIRNRINSFTPEKRYYILETIDFFRNKSHIGSLLPALLTMKGNAQKKELLEFVYITFSTLNKNVETIISIPELFKDSSIHVEQGSLYSFAVEISRIVIRLFHSDYIENFRDYSTEIELLRQIFKIRSEKKHFNEVADNTPVLKGMTDSEDLTRKTILEFVSAIQTHDTLPLYAKKRHEFYKLYLGNLTESGKFKGINPHDVSKVFAGCLMMNNQLTPSETLIRSMAGGKTFQSQSSLKILNGFLATLSPSTVFELINAVRRSVKDLEKREVKVEDHPIKKSIRAVFGGVGKRTR
ncbi:hypothetical protein KKA14_05790, partial [bacterium]|nr:hypothetical protein [bacterium]